MARSSPKMYDVSAEAPSALHFPEVVADFETLGFDRLGRVGFVPGAELGHPTWDLLGEAMFGPDDGPRYAEAKAVPGCVLAAPDRSAFVLVDWWWDMPRIEFWTVLQSGAVVETHRAWDSPPQWTTASKRFGDYRDLDGEQRLASTARGGRTIWLARGGAADLWEAHRRHVSEQADLLGSGPVEHVDVEQALRLGEVLHVHGSACSARRDTVHAVARALLILVGLVLCFLASALDSLWLRGACVVIAAAIGVLLVAYRARIRFGMTRLRYVELFRPPLGAGRNARSGRESRTSG